MTTLQGSECWKNLRYQNSCKGGTVGDIMELPYTLWQGWNENWNRVLTIAKRRNWDYNDLLIHPPASIHTLEQVEWELGVTLPEDFRFVVTHFASRVSFSYFIEDKAPTDWLRKYFYGGAQDLWWLEAMPELRKLFLPDYEYESILPNSAASKQYPFMYSMGDYIVLRIKNADTATPVYCVGQDHGDRLYNSPRKLADSFTEFMTVWSELGCPRPGCYTLDAFRDDTGVLTSDRTLHAEWFDWLDSLADRSR